MNTQYTDSIQNRFTAYLIASITNKKSSYWEHKSRLMEWECINMNAIKQNYSDFNMEFDQYISEQFIEAFDNFQKLHEILRLIEGNRLLEAIYRLKDKEKELLFGHIFGELNFSELSEKLGMTPKQAEMAYYYAIRKIRKRLEGKMDEF